MKNKILSIVTFFLLCSSLPLIQLKDSKKEITLTSELLNRESDTLIIEDDYVFSNNIQNFSYNLIYIMNDANLIINNGVNIIINNSISTSETTHSKIFANGTTERRIVITSNTNKKSSILISNYCQSHFSFCDFKNIDIFLLGSDYSVFFACNFSENCSIIFSKPMLDGTTNFPPQNNEFLWCSFFDNSTIIFNEDSGDTFENNNKFYLNNFYNSTEEIIQENGFSSPINETWNNSEHHGNYWSDYNGTDLNNDRIGDTNLPWRGFDYFPLIYPNVISIILDCQTENSTGQVFLNGTGVSYLFNISRYSWNISNIQIKQNSSSINLIINNNGNYSIKFAVMNIIGIWSLSKFYFFIINNQLVEDNSLFGVEICFFESLIILVFIILLFYIYYKIRRPS